MNTRVRPRSASRTGPGSDCLTPLAPPAPPKQIEAVLLEHYQDAMRWALFLKTRPNKKAD